MSLRDYSINRLGTNRTEVSTPRMAVLYSYETIIGVIVFKEVTAYRLADFPSVTTSKHWGQWRRKDFCYKVQEVTENKLADILDKGYF